MNAWTASPEVTPLERAARDALRQIMAPLSSCQQRVWRLARLHPALFERISFRVRGPLRVHDVAAALREVVGRHAVLRSVFLVVDERPVQCVRSVSSEPLVVNLEGLPGDQRLDAARDLTRGNRQPAFDTRRGPFVRVALLRLSPDDHVLLMTVHHLVFDGDSREILMRELGALLPSPPDRGGPVLPPLTTQYSDIARREQRPNAAADRTARVPRLVARLNALQPPVTLPLDRPRAAYKTRRGHLVPLTIAPATVDAVRQLARTEGVSVFMLLLCALAIVLRRTAAQDEITLGIPVANRTTVEAERIIGPFVNILIARLATSSGMRVRELAAHARTVMLDAFADRDVPFDDLLRARYPTRSLDSYGPVGGTPLFRVCVDYNERTTPPDRGDAALPLPQRMHVTPFGAGDVKAGCDLFVSLSATGSALVGSTLYCAELFERSTVVTFCHRLQHTLAALRSGWQLTLSEFHV